jgi:hypothetical protein
MSETDRTPPAGVDFDPDATPFVSPPIEGMPFERGSEEDAAIQRVIERADLNRDRASRS